MLWQSTRTYGALRQSARILHEGGQEEYSSMFDGQKLTALGFGNVVLERHVLSQYLEVVTTISKVLKNTWAVRATILVPSHENLFETSSS